MTVRKGIVLPAFWQKAFQSHLNVLKCVRPLLCHICIYSFEREEYSGIYEPLSEVSGFCQKFPHRKEFKAKPDLQA